MGLNIEMVISNETERLLWMDAIMEFVTRSRIDILWNLVELRLKRITHTCLNKSCQFNPSKALVKVADCNEYHLSSDDEDNIKNLLYKNGPLSIATQDKDIQGYTGGVLKSCFGNPYLLDYAVLLVGYGTDKEENEPYWLVKNSWGPTWGEDRFFRVKRDGNPCGFINSFMSSPVLA